MAAPADEREHAFTIPKFKLRDFSPSSAPTTDHEQMFQSEGTFPVPSVLVSNSRGSLESRGCPRWPRGRNDIDR
jgi:hypothetical protein